MLASEQGMVSKDDAKRGIAILELNPNERLALLGTRLARIGENFKGLAGAHENVNVLLETARDEVNTIKRLIDFYPGEENNEPN